MSERADSDTGNLQHYYNLGMAVMFGIAMFLLSMVLVGPGVDMRILGVFAVVMWIYAIPSIRGRL